MGIGAVGGLGIAIKVIGEFPVGFGNFRDGIDAIADIGPVACQALRLGEQAPYSDDGHRNRGRGSGRIQVFALSIVVNAGADAGQGAPATGDDRAMLDSESAVLNLGEFQWLEARQAGR